MPPSVDFHKGSIGATIRLRVTDGGNAWTAVGSATTMKIKLRPPGRPTLEFDAQHTTDGTDGLIEYTTTAVTDLPVAGEYEVQGYLVIPGVWTGHTEIGHIVVGPAL